MRRIPHRPAQSVASERNPQTETILAPCGFKYHRDGVGAINIRQKYLGHLGDPVVAVMVPPLGLRLEVPVALT